MNKNIIIGVIIGIFAHMISWFSFNSQFVWEYWKDKPIMSTMFFGFPANLAFWYASLYLLSETKNLYQTRWILFGLSFFPLLILTTSFLGQNFFTAKNLITIILSILIIIVQLC